MKKVFFLIPTLSIGGGERVVSELSLNFNKSINTTIILFKKEISYPYKGRIVSLDIFFSKNPFLKIYFYLKALNKFRKIVRSEKPDYIISFGHPANVINILSKRRGSKVLARVDNFYSSSCYGFGGAVYKLLIKILFNRADIIIDVSKESAEDLVENFGVKEKKVKVIYNPLDIKKIDALSVEPLLKEHEKIFENPVVINMGRMNRQKGQKYLIEAFLQIKNKIKNTKLVILGEGELEEELKAFSKKYGLSEDIYFLGWQKNPFKFLARSKMFLLSSLWEGLPYVLLESMACSLPIVSFDCASGPREILAPGTDFKIKMKGIEYAKYGILVEKQNKDLLAKASIELLSNNGMLLKMKEKSRERINDFDIKNIIKEWDFLEHD